MPRPPKQVPPETLGGRIRAAREQLGLSLAQVASGHYSTSLLSQIERNRIEPSQESLKFLVEKLQLPLEDLQALAQQQKTSEAEMRQYREYDNLRVEASNFLAQKQPSQACDRLMQLNLSHVPPLLRWRLAALRGHCHFTLRQFIDAQRDFLYATTELPEHIPADQHKEAMTLHLYLAATLRELKQYKKALEQYQLALKMMDRNTSLTYVAEAHWGMSLIASEQANQAGHLQDQQAQLSLALKHAENACILYRSIGETLQAALLTCQIGLIEQASGQVDKARQALEEVRLAWQPELDRQRLVVTETESKTDKEHLKEIANVVSVAACSLAGIELDAKNYSQALIYVRQARDAAQHSYTLRQAEAEMMFGCILEGMNDDLDTAEEAFQRATELLLNTHRLAARIRAHGLLGLHLRNKGKTEASKEQFDVANRLLKSALPNSTIDLYNDHNEIAKPA